MSATPPSSSVNIADKILEGQVMFTALGVPPSAINNLTAATPWEAAAAEAAAATVEDCTDENDIYIDDETLLNEAPIELVEPPTTEQVAATAAAPTTTAPAKPAPTRTTDVDLSAEATAKKEKPAKDANDDNEKTIVHYISQGKLNFSTLVGGVLLRNKAPKKPAEASTNSDEKGLQPKNTQLMKQLTLAANRCGDFLAGMVKEGSEDENGAPLADEAESKNVLWRLDQEISNEILAQRAARKTRKPNPKEEMLHITRVFELPELKPGEAPRAKEDSGWSSLETSSLRDERVAAYYDKEQIERFESLEPNNSSMRLLVVETMFKTDLMHARLRMYVYFRIKWKDDKENAAFDAARANVKKPGAKSATGGTKTKRSAADSEQAPAIISPVNVQQSTSKFTHKNSVVVLATFWECNPIETKPKEFMKKLLGKSKEKIIAAAEIPKLPENAATTTPIAAASEPMPKLEETAPVEAATSSSSSSSSSTTTSTSTTTETVAEKKEEVTAAASPEKSKDADDDGDLSNDLKHEIKKMSEDYQAKCLAIQLCMHEYTRLRMQARMNMFQTRIDAVVTFVLMTFGLDLCLRVLAAKPHIPAPLAIIVFLERNGSIVNLDETTFVTEDQLNVYLKTEHEASASMRVYRELQAAFNSSQFNPRSNIILHLIERGKFQDLGQNLSRTTISDFHYKRMEEFVNTQLKQNATKPGEPKTVEECFTYQMRANQQQKKQSKAPPAT